MASTIAEVATSYAVNTSASPGTGVTTSWGAGRVSGNTGNLLLAFCYNTVGTGTAGTPAITGWTQVATVTSGVGRATLLYKYATAGDTGTVSYIIAGAAGLLALFEISGVNAVTYNDVTAITNSELNSSTMTLGTSTTVHVSAGALGFAVMGHNATIGASPTFQMTPPVSAGTAATHTLNGTPSMIAGIAKYSDTVVTETGSNAFTWTTARTGAGMFVSIRPSTYSSTGQTIAGSEVVADSVAPATSESLTGASLVAAETVADSVAPATSESATGVTVTAAAADTNNAQATSEQLIANTVTMTSDTTNASTVVRASDAGQALSGAVTANAVSQGRAEASGGLSGASEVSSPNRSLSATGSGQVDASLTPAGGVGSIITRALAQTLGISFESLGGASSSKVSVGASTVTAAVIASNLHVKYKMASRAGKVSISSTKVASVVAACKISDVGVSAIAESVSVAAKYKSAGV